MDLYLDCGNGISGDMTLAALVHLGLDIAPLASALARAGVNCRIETWPETRVGGPGRRVDVSWDEVQPLRHHAHDRAAKEAQREGEGEGPRRMRAKDQGKQREHRPEGDDARAQSLAFCGGVCGMAPLAARWMRCNASIIS